MGAWYFLGLKLRSLEEELTGWGGRTMGRAREVHVGKRSKKNLSGNFPVGTSGRVGDVSVVGVHIEEDLGNHLSGPFWEPFSESIFGTPEK